MSEDDEDLQNNKKIYKNESSNKSRMPTTLMSLNNRKNILDNGVLIANSGKYILLVGIIIMYIK